jgi:hypothetical protein
MAVVRSLEGTFYDIPDSELGQYKVPADKVKGLMEAAGQKAPSSPGQQPGGQGQGGASGSPQILVQFIVQGQGGAQQKPQAAPAEGEEKVEPQWYWINWANWANWYNWY